VSGPRVITPMTDADRFDAKAVVDAARIVGKLQLAGGRAPHQGCNEVCATAQVLVDALIVLSCSTPIPAAALLDAASALLDVVEKAREASAERPS
jgi:hypothetical protein